MRHTNIQKIFPLFLFLCLGAFIVFLATAQTQPAPTTITLHTGTKAEINNLPDAHRWWNTTTGFLRDRNDEMQDLERQLAILNYGLNDAYDTLISEYITSLGALGSPLSSLASSVIQLRKNEQIWEIKRDRVRKYAEIAVQQSRINAYAADRDDVYAIFQAWWEYTYSGSNPVPEKSPLPKQVSVPSTLTLECENECGSSWTGSSSAAEALITKATTRHEKTCDEKPHKGHKYFSCPPNYRGCDKSKEHWVLCKGVCGQEGPKRWVTNPNPKEPYTNILTEPGWIEDMVVTIPGHRKACPYYVMTGILKRRKSPCPYYYYQCKSSNTCPNSGNHVSSNVSPQACGHTYDPNSSSAYTHRSVNYACGSHSYYACQTPSTSSHRSISYACSTHTYYACQTPSTSSHAYVSSCSETSNGNTCNNSSGYYACALHSHTYPSAPPPPPSTPTRPTCTACNVSYNPNSTYHVNLHRPRECRFSGCGNRWHACSIEGWSPPCNNAYRKSKGWKCGAK